MSKDYAKSFFVPLYENFQFTYQAVKSCEKKIIDGEENETARKVVDMVFQKIKEYVVKNYPEIHDGDVINTLKEADDEKQYSSKLQQLNGFNQGKYIWYKGNPEFLDYSINSSSGSLPDYFQWGPNCQAKHPNYWINCISDGAINYPEREIREGLYKNLKKLPSGKYYSEFKNTKILFSAEECNKEDILNEAIPFELSPEEKGESIDFMETYWMPGTIYFQKDVDGTTLV